MAKVSAGIKGKPEYFSPDETYLLETNQRGRDQDSAMKLGAATILVCLALAASAASVTATEHFDKRSVFQKFHKSLYEMQHPEFEQHQFQNMHSQNMQMEAQYTQG
ncbi:uncharacterized protein LOC144100087 [Amblyomma americanum]